MRGSLSDSELSNLHPKGIVAILHSTPKPTPDTLHRHRHPTSDTNLTRTLILQTHTNLTKSQERRLTVCVCGLIVFFVCLASKLICQGLAAPSLSSRALTASAMETGATLRESPRICANGNDVHRLQDPLLLLSVGAVFLLQLLERRW